MFVIVSGNPFDGLRIIGPFEDSDPAIEYANWHANEHNMDADWWIVPIEKRSD